MTQALGGREYVADAAVHAIGLLAGIVGAVVMLVAALPGQVAPIAVYVAGLIAMLSCSAAYNVWRSHRARDWLRRLDHAAIFVMIAGTYTPLTILRLPDAWSVALTIAVWVAAALGIAFKLWQPRRIESISVVLYLVLGWIGVVAIRPLLASVESGTLLLLLAGGLVYSAGVLFHLSRGRRYQVALWHGSVLVAATLHYFAILRLL